MYLKRLELQGFKSFADKTVLEFKQGITSVIGPNGSGKSNISDSIRWVLGEQSMKSLRGTKSEDIIFAGTQNRKSLGFAEASIIIDNSDGKLPIEYSEVTVTRKIFRSGETGYFINKVPCRLKDVLELFMDTGIGKDGYSIIGQGKIDEILSNKSEDRRHIFEEATGIVRYRTRKVESEKKLEQTKLNLLRINDIISEIEANIEPLKLQSEKAKQFLNLREELKQIEVGLFVYKIEEYREKLQKFIDDIQILENQRIEETEKLENLKRNKEQLKIEVDNITLKVEELQNFGFESSNNLEKINSSIILSKEKIVHNNENIQRVQKEKLELESRITELEQEITGKKEKKEGLLKNKEKFEKELKEKEDSLNIIVSKMSNKELEIEQKKKEVEILVDEKYEKSAEITALTTNIDNSNKRKQILTTENMQIISELDSKRTDKQEISKYFYEMEAKRNNLLKEKNDIKLKKQLSNKKQEEFEIKINEICNEIRIKDSKRKFLIETEKEKDGYIKSVKSLLNACEKDLNLKNGVCGVLANLISVEKKYEIAIEMCLGAAMQNIVTENEKDAKKLIEYLRNNNLGRASFLPITSVKGKKLEKFKTNTNGVIGIASDLIKYEKKYEQIIISLLGRTVIVEEMDDAINLAKQNGYLFKIVTLNGDVINSSGAISGGSIAQKTVNLLGRSREIEDLQIQINELEKNKSELETEKEQYINSIKDILNRSQELEENLKNIDIDYATEKQKMISIEETVARLEKNLENIKYEINNIEQSRIDDNTKRENLEKEISNIEEKCKENNKVIEEFANKNRENQKIVDDLNFDITNLKISVSSFDESGLSIEEMIERINQDIEMQKNSIANKEQEAKNMVQENEKLEQDILEFEAKIEEIKQTRDSSLGEIEALKESRNNKNKKMQILEAEVLDQFNSIEEIKEQCVKMDVKKSNIEQDLEQIINKLWEEYEITPNNATEYEKPQNISTTEKQVKQLRNDIKDLGSINVDSIEEYKRTKERYDFMSEQRSDLESTASKLRKIIGEMTENMKTQFAEKFKQINKNFEEVFVELFGGGKAELTLSDENNILECGIEIKVQPPGKKLQNMMLLSGGEKAFTAIAILFAILKINPAPFCVLDEIEAALDDVNVYRYADYLKRFSDSTQFLVITHRKGTMEAANSVYGVTMEENGVSKLLSMKLGK